MYDDNTQQHRTSRRKMVYQFLWDDGKVPTYIGDSHEPRQRGPARDPLDHTLSWGKYRGIALRVLAKGWETRHYLAYMVTRDVNAYDIDCMQRALDATPDVDPTYDEARAFTMCFGMFKGESLGQILDGHKRGLRYIRWIRDTTNCSRQLGEAIDVLIPG